MRKETRHSEESNEKNRQAHLGKHPSEETKKKIGQAGLGRPGYWKGKHRSEETKEKLRQVGLGKHQTKESKENNRRAHLGKHFSDKHKEKLSEATKKLWRDPEFIKKISKGWHSKTRPEKSLETILNLICPDEFKYNGGFDCGISIDGLIPDFVNVNGQKQVIDVHGDYWHKDEDIDIRIERYAKYGYSLLIIWEKELKNRSEVVKRIVSFVGKDQSGPIW